MKSNDLRQISLSASAPRVGRSSVYALVLAEGRPSVIDSGARTDFWELTESP